MSTAIKLPRRKCHECREWFFPKYANVVWCCAECGATVAMKRRSKERDKAIQAQEKKRKLAEVEQRDKLKIRKLAVKPTAYFKKQAQDEFNAYIRERDEGRPCISCGETNPPDLHGGKWDCGHFLSVGSHPEIRFEERNAFRQCKKCNGGAGHYARKNHTVSQNYEANLIAEFGQGYVDWLRGPHEPTRYRREDFIRIRDEYKAKRKALIASREEAA